MILPFAQKEIQYFCEQNSVYLSQTSYCRTGINLLISSTVQAEWYNSQFYQFLVLCLQSKLHVLVARFLVESKLNQVSPMWMSVSHFPFMKHFLLTCQEESSILTSALYRTKKLLICSEETIRWSDLGFFSNNLLEQCCTQNLEHYTSMCVL